MKQYFYYLRNTMLFVFIILSFLNCKEDIPLEPISSSDVINAQPIFDGVAVDNFDSLQHYCNNIPANGLIGISKDIQFKYGQTLVIENKIRIVGIGESKPILSNDSSEYDYTMFDVRAEAEIENIIFEGFEIVASNRSAIRIGGLPWTTKYTKAKAIIKNCEIRGWYWSGIVFTNYTTGVVQDNFIHDNLAERLGYGVSIYTGAFAKILNNKFDHNRHSIASDGHPDSGYEAAYNDVYYNTSHAFDMHGNRERLKDSSRTDWRAGGRILIHNNNFYDATEQAVVIRGVPTVECRIYDNNFAHNWIWYSSTGTAEGGNTQALRQYSENNNFGKIYVYNNNFGDKSLPYWYNCFFATLEVQYNGNWTKLAAIFPELSIEELGFGDFNNDGITDVISNYNVSTIENKSGKGKGNYESGKIYISWSGLTDWMLLNDKNTLLSNLAIADFNGDGKDDLFKSENGEWLVSYQGSGKWETLTSSDIKLDGLKFADINNDGKMDILTNIDQEFYVSEGGKTPLRKITTENISFRDNNLQANLDFNGDGENETIRISK